MQMITLARLIFTTSPPLILVPCGVDQVSTHCIMNHHIRNMLDAEEDRFNNPQAVHVAFENPVANSAFNMVSALAAVEAGSFDAVMPDLFVSYARDLMGMYRKKCRDIPSENLLSENICLFDSFRSAQTWRAVKAGFLDSEGMGGRPLITILRPSHGTRHHRRSRSRSRRFYFRGTLSFPYNRS